MTHQKVSASGLILNKLGKILMVKRSESDDFLPGIYELPGGGTDYMEDPAKGLEREFLEECGIKIKVLHPLTTFSFNMPHEGVDKHTVEIIYLCELEDENQKIKLSFEHCDYKWMSFDEVLDTPDNPVFTTMMRNIQQHPLIQAS